MSRSLVSLRMILFACVVMFMPAFSFAVDTGVRGQVLVYGENRPIAGAYVSCVQLDTTQTVVVNKVTGVEGNYSATGLKPGRWLVMAWANNYLPAYQPVEVKAGVMATANLVLRTQNGSEFGVLEGEVVNAKTGSPIPGAWVFYGYDPANGPVPAVMFNVIADASGHFRAANLSPTDYISYAQAPGYATAHQNFKILAGQVTHLHYALEPISQSLPGAIAGRVLDAGTSAPLVGARVYYGPLYSATDTFRWFDAAGTPTQPYVVTNAEGGFKIENLAPGLYYMLASAEKHQRQEMKVVVVSGQTARVVFRLRQEPVQPSGLIEGLVTNQAGKPIAGARIWYSPYYGQYIQAPYVVTGTDGRYLIRNVPPGDNHLTVKAEGYLGQSRVVQVVADQTTTANFILQPITVAYGTIIGKVQDAKTSAPLAGVVIRVMPDGTVIASATSAAAIYGETVTNSNGEYRLEQIPAGKVSVIAAKVGYMTASKTATVVSAATIRVDFRMYPSSEVPRGKIIGRVRAAANEQPVAGAVVRMAPGATPLAGSIVPPRETITDENGQYGFENVPVGQYAITASKPGYFDQTKPAAVAAGSTTEVNFLLQSAPSFDAGKLVGKVVDDVTSAPIAMAWVAVHIEMTDSLTAIPSQLVAYTNSYGRFEMPRVPVGEWTVWAARKGYMPSSQTVKIVKDQVTEIKFRLQPIKNGGVVEGNVRDTTSGAALANIHVIIPLIDLPHMSNENTALHAVTGVNGHYRIEGVPAGERTIKAFGLNYQSESGVITVVSGQAVQKDFFLTRVPATQAISVRVISSRSGLPIVGARLSVPLCDAVEPFSGWDLLQTTSSSSGLATLLGVPVGSYFLVGAVANYEPTFILLPGANEAPSADPITMLLAPQTSGNAVTTWVNYE